VKGGFPSLSGKGEILPFAFCFLPWAGVSGHGRRHLPCCSLRFMEEPGLCLAVSLRDAAECLKTRGLKTPLQVIYHLLDSNLEKYWMLSTYTLAVFPPLY